MRLYLKDIRSGSPTGYNAETDQIVGYNRAMAAMEDTYRIIDLDDADGWTNDPEDTSYSDKFTEDMIERGLFAMVRPQQTGVFAPGIGGPFGKEPTTGDENKTKLEDVPGVGVLVPAQQPDRTVFHEVIGTVTEADPHAVREGLTPTRSEAEKSGQGPTVDEEARSDKPAEVDTKEEKAAKRREQLAAARRAAEE